MSIKSIIMPFASQEDGDTRLEGGLHVAKFFLAHLDVLHAQVGSEQLMPHEQRLVSRKFYDQIGKIVRDYVSNDMSQAKSRFSELCQSLNVIEGESSLNQTSATWHDIFGYRGEVVAERGKVSDVIIIPKSLTGRTSVSFEAAIEHGGKPVLVMPRTQRHFAPKTVMIAWNGDEAAANAVSSALPLLKLVDNVVVATSERSLAKKPTQIDLATYLARHGVDAECLTFTRARRNTASQLLEVASEIKADVVVAGAFAHQKLHQKVFGGVTNQLLSSATIPLWMMS
ncbi:universal stress protein [Vibrio cholerae]